MATTLIIAEAVARARTYYLELLDEYLLTLKGGGNCGDGHYAKLMCLKKLIRALDWDLTAGINDETTTAIYERLILEMVGYDNTIVLSTDPNVIIPTITIIAGVAGKDGKDGKDGRTIRIIQQDDPPMTIDGTPGGAPIQDGEVLWYCTLSDSPRGGRTFQRYDGQWIETGTAFIHKVTANEGNTTQYVLPVATDTVLGGVKQGANITIAPDGTISTEAGTIGADGQDGAPGAPGSDGNNGIDGADGLSAYQIALNNGFVGTEAAWLVSLKGADGADGVDGADSTIPGPAGQDGADGAPGATGAPGPGVPTGGTTGQVLSKINGTDYNTNWIDPPATGSVVADASETVKGIVELATVAEALARTDDQRALTALKTIALILDEAKNFERQYNMLNQRTFSILMRVSGSFSSIETAGISSLRIKNGSAGTFATPTFPYTYTGGDRIFFDFIYNDTTESSGNLILIGRDN